MQSPEAAQYQRAGFLEAASSSTSYGASPRLTDSKLVEAAMIRARKRLGKTGKAGTASKEVASPVLRGGMPRALGIRVTFLTRKKVIAEMPIKAMHLNVNGRVNGGAIMSFADVVAAAGAVANRPAGYRGGTIESKANFFAAGTGPVLRAVSVPLHVGRTTSVWQTTIKNSDGRTVAIVTQTQIMMPARGDSAEENG